MFSSETMNKLFGSIAKFVGRLTGREIQFYQVGRGETLPFAVEKMNKLFESISEALDNPVIQRLGTLEPGKVYCLQIDLGAVDTDWVLQIAEDLRMKNILIVLVDKNMNFLSVPEGYEMVKKEEKG